jgi:hypothetical protein
MNTVIKPISLFLNDIEEYYLHNPANAKAALVLTSLIKPVFFYTSSKVVRISLLRMTCVTFLKGVPFKDAFQVENGKVIHVAENVHHH